MRKRDKAHLQKIAELPCSLCGAYPPSNVHHIRTGQGLSQRASDFLTVPLCRDCHQGDNGVHGDKSLLNIRKLDELDLLAWTIERLEVNTDAAKGEN